MKYDFDTFIDRRGSGSYKWDEYKDDPADMIHLWIADMDFRTAPSVVDAICRRANHGVFGYTYVPDGYYDALCSWFDSRHGYKINRDNVIYTSGVVPGVSAIIKALTKPGDGVILNVPAYNCFFSSIRNNGCRIVESPLIRKDKGEAEFTFEIDFDDLERLAAEESNKIFILCNPHNPTGRVWTADELRRVADICRRHNVTVICDEIHCELTMPGHKYLPYGNIDERAIICNSPSKGFNVGGLQIANIIAPDADLRARIDRAINDNEVCDVNPFGTEALVAAYNQGGEWLDALNGYLAGNFEEIRKFLAEKLPELRMSHLEATYLAWIDVTPTGLDGDEIEKYLCREAHVRVNGGSMYGDRRYIRLNFALPRPRLKEALSRIERPLRALLDK